MYIKKFDSHETINEKNLKSKIFVMEMGAYP
jgi:hypothetical protein